MRRSWLLLVFATALGLWLWQTRKPPAAVSAGAAGAAGGTETGYVAVNAELMDTDADGKPKYQLRASRIEQHELDADVALSGPQFQYTGPTTWTLNAQRGVLPADGQQVNLSGEVLIVGTRPGEEALSIRSDEVSVDLQQQRLDTASPVVIDWGHNAMTATGLHADMKAESLRLESKVHGEFAH